MAELVKAVTPGRGRALLTQGVGWLGGYVVRAADIASVQTPAELHAEMGLGFPGSPLTADAAHIDTMRIPTAPYLLLHAPGTESAQPAFRDHSPLSGTGFVETAVGFVPYWWLQPTAIPAGTTLWRNFADGRREMLAVYPHVADGWVSARPGFTLPPTPLRAPQLTGLWAEMDGARVVADVLPDGTVILCFGEQADGLRQGVRGLWWRAAGAGEVTRVYAVRVLATWEGRAVQLVGVEQTSEGDRAQVVYVGHDALDAESLGMTKTDAGVYEAVVAVDALHDLQEQQLDVPVALGSGPQSMNVRVEGGMSGVVRDSRADEEFLTRAIAVAEAGIASNEKRLERPVEKWRKPDSLAMAAGHAVKPHWELFSVRYSAGASAVSLRGVFDGLLVASERACRLEKELFSEDLVQLQFRNVRIKDYYLEWLQLVSLAIAFEVDDAVFDRVVAAVEFGWGDRLIDRLIASRRPGHPVGDELLFPKLSGVLDEAFTSSDPARVVKRYLAKWYTTWKGIVGWGDHEVIPKFGYFGYWAFEVLGVVKVLGIDDASFRDDVYYPRDLAAL